MKSKHLRFAHGFRVVTGDSRSQAATMVLEPGGTEGGEENQHSGADQWLYVVNGRGIAIINHRRVQLREGTILLIERGDRHEIRNNGRSSLITLNIYVPPAYTPTGEELPAGRSTHSRR